MHACPITLDETKGLIRLFLISNLGEATVVGGQEYKPVREEIKT